ncbi:MAG: hypothetical protein FWD72_00230 [Eggerthellaceae bacterium]|nr:hypothetical protein [Eggerthellaceae bacterium]
MRPMNYAILKVFENGKTFDAEAVMDEIRGEYGGFRAFKKRNVTESLMSAEKNGLLERSNYDLDDKDELHIYYQATEYGVGMIKKYIK